jgi:hypothetical protein
MGSSAGLNESSNLAFRSAGQGWCRSPVEKTVKTLVAQAVSQSSGQAVKDSYDGVFETLTEALSRNSKQRLA